MIPTWPRRGAALALALALGLPLAASESARAGVPRSCIHPQADPIQCPRDTWKITERVLPAARVRALRRQRHELLRVAPAEDRERNRLLEAIRRDCADC